MFVRADTNYCIKNADIWLLALLALIEAITGELEQSAHILVSKQDIEFFQQHRALSMLKELPLNILAVCHELPAFLTRTDFLFCLINLHTLQSLILSCIHRTLEEWCLQKVNASLDRVCFSVETTMLFKTGSQWRHVMLWSGPSSGIIN